MKKIILLIVLFASAQNLSAQKTSGSFPKNEISINGFRNPSIGIEYHRSQVSLHAGYYLTNLTSGVTTSFIKTGATYWLLPIGKKDIPSSFYIGASYMRGIDREYEDKDAIGAEAGFRWMIWKGLNFRIGAIALMAKGKDVKINPTPGLSYSFKF